MRPHPRTIPEPAAVPPEGTAESLQQGGYGACIAAPSPPPLSRRERGAAGPHAFERSARKHGTRIGYSAGSLNPSPLCCAQLPLFYQHGPEPFISVADADLMGQKM